MIAADRALAAKVGAAVRRHRLHRKMQGQELATAAGINKSYVSQIESGKRLPKIPTLIDLARALGVELRELV